MKTTMLALFMILAVGMAFAQDTTATPAGNFYADSLITGTHDTVDVVVSSMFGIDHFKITAYSTSADTLVVLVNSPDGTLWAQHGVYNLATGGAAVLYCVTSTTVKDWIILGGPEVRKFRFTSTGAIGEDSIYFIVSGQRGQAIY